MYTASNLGPNRLCPFGLHGWLFLGIPQTPTQQPKLTAESCRIVAQNPRSSTSTSLLDSFMSQLPGCHHVTQLLHSSLQLKTASVLDFLFLGNLLLTVPPLPNSESTLVIISLRWFTINCSLRNSDIASLVRCPMECLQRLCEIYG